MKAIVLAGGLGTRLRDRVSDLPKPMAPVAGRPFLEYLLDRLPASGIDAVVLSVGYRWQAIEAHFGSSFRGMPIRYAIEAQPLGTGGAIRHAIREAGPGDEGALLVLNGDTFLDVDLAAVISCHRREGRPITLTLRRVDDVERYGAVRMQGERVIAFAEKSGPGPGLVNGGIYVIERDWLLGLDLPETFSLERDLLQPSCPTLQPAGYVTDARFIDIGIPEDFDRAQTLIPAWTA